MTLTSIITVSDTLSVMNGVITVQYELVSMTTVMLHSCFRPTAEQSLQSWWKWLRLRNMIMVDHGNCGE
jgi:hypothetical protein